MEATPIFVPFHNGESFITAGHLFTELMQI